MDAHSFELVLSEDKKHLTLLIKGETFLVMDAGQVQNLLSQVGMARIEMHPRVAMNPPEPLKDLHQLSGFLTLDHRTGEVAHPPLEAGMSLALRSEAFGWQRQALSPQDCQALLLHLQGGLPPAPADATLN